MQAEEEREEEEEGERERRRLERELENMVNINSRLRQTIKSSNLYKGTIARDWFTLS
jgi:hypothetical protein